MNDCYWYQVLADIGLLGMLFFATLWFLLRRRYREQREVWREYVKNVGAVTRQYDMFAYQQWLHEQDKDKPE